MYPLGMIGGVFNLILPESRLPPTLAHAVVFGSDRSQVIFNSEFPGPIPLWVCCSQGPIGKLPEGQSRNLPGPHLLSPKRQPQFVVNQRTG